MKNKYRFEAHRVSIRLNQKKEADGCYAVFRIKLLYVTDGVDGEVVKVLEESPLLTRPQMEAFKAKHRATVKVAMPNEGDL